jgi:hypothetical protein
VLATERQCWRLRAEQQARELLSPEEVASLRKREATLRISLSAAESGERQ